MDADFFISNRRSLSERIDGLVVLTAGKQMQRCYDEAYRFEQEANFWYLTGINEPDWKLIIHEGESVLVAPKISEISGIFNEHLDAKQALEISGANSVIAESELLDYLKSLTAKNAYTIFPQKQSDYEFQLNSSQNNLTKMLKKHFKSLNDVRPNLNKLRAIKQKPEIMMMRRAINLTRSAFEIVKSELDSYNFEYEAQARFSYEFERTGASHAYDPIVAGGKNAVTLHYNSNRDGLRQDELVLMDVGASYGGYSADITRTHAFGEATERQRAVHRAVKQAKDQIIDLLKPGKNVKEYLSESDEIMREALRSLNLYESKDDFRKYYPHAISHGLGIETHDPLGAPETFAVGMVLTVEPGIYIPEENIGVRLEDDILIKETGYENLSKLLSSEL